MNRHKFISVLTSTTSAVLIVAGFVLPPVGVIDNSVFSAVGLLLAFKTVDLIPELMERKGNATVTVGNTSISVGNKKRMKNKGEITETEENN